MSSEKHGRHAFATSRNPYTCGLTGKTYTASEFVARTDYLARALAKRLRFDPHDGTEWDRVVGLFSLNTVSPHWRQAPCPDFRAGEMNLMAVTAD